MPAATRSQPKFGRAIKIDALAYFRAGIPLAIRGAECLAVLGVVTFPSAAAARRLVEYRACRASNPSARRMAGPICVSPAICVPESAGLPYASDCCALTDWLPLVGVNGGSPGRARPWGPGQGPAPATFGERFERMSRPASSQVPQARPCRLRFRSRRPQPLRRKNFPGRTSRPPRGRCAANFFRPQSPPLHFGRGQVERRDLREPHIAAPEFGRTGCAAVSSRSTTRQKTAPPARPVGAARPLTATPAPVRRGGASPNSSELGGDPAYPASSSVSPRPVH
jgi:hypothetical protein